MSAHASLGYYVEEMPLGMTTWHCIYSCTTEEQAKGIVRSLAIRNPITQYRVVGQDEPETSETEVP